MRNTTLQYAPLDISEYGSYLCFFYLDKVIFAVLDVSALLLQKCQTLDVFYINTERNNTTKYIKTQNLFRKTIRLLLWPYSQLKV